MPPVLPFLMNPHQTQRLNPFSPPPTTLARSLSLLSLIRCLRWTSRNSSVSVSCETLVDAAGGGERWPYPPPVALEDADILAVSSEHEIGWADRNAAYDRNDSTTGRTNPKSSNARRRGPAASNSQFFSTNLKAKPPIIGLPGKIQHSGFDSRTARRPPRIRIFPKKAKRAEGGGRGKSAVPESEPGSPKVSCFGKVLSNRERERRRREGQRAAEGEREERGCSPVFAVIFRCGGGGQMAEEQVEKKIAVPARNIPVLAGSVPESSADAPVLGEMRRFVSGRRAASWGAEAEAGAGAKTERVGVWGPRSMGSVGDGERGRE